jgi:hypothetical protein
MTIFCRKCDGANEFDRNWIEETDACKFCGSAGLWRTINEPKHTYDLSLNDQRFLRSLRIAPE